MIRKLKQSTGEKGESFTASKKVIDPLAPKISEVLEHGAATSRTKKKTKDVKDARKEAWKVRMEKKAEFENANKKEGDIINHDFIKYPRDLNMMPVFNDTGHYHCQGCNKRTFNRTEEIYYTKDAHFFVEKVRGRVFQEMYDPRPSIVNIS